MRSLLFGLLVACFVVCLIGSVASAAVTNLGPDLPLPTDTNVLTADGTTDAILYAPSEADDAAFRSAIAAQCSCTVDYFNASTGTPDAALLANYDCVLVWANFAFADPVGYGDNLADFVDAGGHVVLGAFCAYTSGNFLDGRIMDPGYCPVIGGSNHFTFSSYIGDGTTDIYNGVATLGATYRDYLSIQGDGAVDGHYADGEICHAYRPDFAVIYANGCGGAPIDGSAPDWPLAVSNSCAAGAPPTPTIETSWGKIKSLY
jgi:hypothetical protein